MQLRLSIVYQICCVMSGRTRWTVLLLVFLAIAGGCSGTNEEETPVAPAPLSDKTGAEGQFSTDEDNQLIRLRNVALAHLEAEDHVEAARLFDQLIDRVPEEPMAHANRGLIALREDRIAEAFLHLDTAARLAPDDADIAVLRSMAYVSQGNDDEARNVLEPVVEKNPNHLRSRWELMEILKRTPPEAVGEDLLLHLGDLLERLPRNVVLRLSFARNLLARGQLEAAAEQLAALDQQGVIDTQQALTLLKDARTGIEEGDARTARMMVIALNNVLKPTKAWQKSLAELRGPPVPVAEPIWDFLVHPVIEPNTGPGNIDVTYKGGGEALTIPIEHADKATALVQDPGAKPIILATSGMSVLVYQSASGSGYELAQRLQLDQIGTDSGVTVSQILAVDWNNDRLMDAICGLTDGSVQLCTRNEDGNWVSVDRGSLPPPPEGSGACRLLLPWDADQDGDLDILVGRDDVRATVLRNNGDGTFAETAVDLGIAVAGDPAVLDAAVADLDEDGDLDLVMVTARGTMSYLKNLRSGRFQKADLGLDVKDVRHITIGDFDNDGWLDLAFLTKDGSLHLGINRSGIAFEHHRIGTIEVRIDNASIVLDLDYNNDGHLDLLILAGSRVHLFENTGRLEFVHLRPALPPDAAGVTGVEIVDHDWDGDLDLLLTFKDGRCMIWDNDLDGRHGWQMLQLDAIRKGGQRNNTFGLGGTIEIRAGRFYQKRMVKGPVTYFGLGEFGPLDTVRVVWPNGVPQEIISPEPNQLITEKQTLKGSCPYLMIPDGGQYRFVTDLLWRSPLGMKINAQTVAPVSSTKDYVKIEAKQLQPHNGRYELAITAALWETNFVDEVELRVVDHPASVDVFVDERFLTPEIPPFQIHVVDRLRTPISARDHRGQDVLELIRNRDGNRLGGFALGRYQGIAEMHHVELDLGAWGEPQTVTLLASGWIMPTDTSINVAIGQGDLATPVPLNVSVSDGGGGWLEVIPNAGFPAGKLKTIILDLTGLFPTSDHRIRLRTNLEIYWDRIAFALGDPPYEAKTVTCTMLRADIEYLGFPRISRKDAQSPELPDYGHLSKRPRWRDLHGYYTRYGDVQELLAETDDRYVIMNAGDQILLSFDVPPPPPEGWIRDFILFTDGWVKDGDWNTVESMTVNPLPFHGMSDYPYPLQQIPPTLRPDHPDWQRFHTRFVTSDSFRDRMRPPGVQ